MRPDWAGMRCDAGPGGGSARAARSSAGWAGRAVAGRPGGHVIGERAEDALALHADGGHRVAGRRVGGRRGLGLGQDAQPRARTASMAAPAAAAATMAAPEAEVMSTICSAMRAASSAARRRIEGRGRGLGDGGGRGGGAGRTRPARRRRRWGARPGRRGGGGRVRGHREVLGDRHERPRPGRSTRLLRPARPSAAGSGGGASFCGDGSSPSLRRPRAPSFCVVGDSAGCGSFCGSAGAASFCGSAVAVAVARPSAAPVAGSPPASPPSPPVTAASERRARSGRCAASQITAKISDAHSAA